MPTPWHYHHHASLMRWYVLDHEQFLSFFILFSSHHSGTRWYLSHLSIGCCSRTVKAFLDVVWQTLIWSSCFWGSPMVYILWWTLCIHSGEVFSWLLTLTHIHLPPGECSCSWTVVKGFFFTREIIILSSTTVVLWSSGSFVVAELTSAFFLSKCSQRVDLATPNVFAISLIGLFWFFSLMMACFTDSDSSLDLILRATDSKCKWHTWNEL